MNQSSPQPDSRAQETLRLQACGDQMIQMHDVAALSA